MLRVDCELSVREPQQPLPARPTCSTLAADQPGLCPDLCEASSSPWARRIPYVLHHSPLLSLSLTRSHLTRWATSSLHSRLVAVLCGAVLNVLHRSWSWLSQSGGS